MRARRWVPVVGLVAGVQLTACKPDGPSRAPSRDVRSWSLAEIEAELQRNDAVLASEGIMVAAASVPSAEPSSDEASSAESSSDEPLAAEPDEDGGAPVPEAEAAPDELDAPEPPPMTYAPDQPVEAEERSYARSRERRARKSSSRSDEAPSRCERVCDLAEATCELEAQICELATRHPDEPRYARACLRAEQQCVAAMQACDRCDE